MTDGSAGRRLHVGIVGCGLIGRKRALALGSDRLIGCTDVDSQLAVALADEHSVAACKDTSELLTMQPDIVIVAVPHNALAALACQSLRAGAHVLVEKPAGIGVADVDRIAAAAGAAGRRVKVGFNHRFHPGISRAVEEARSGRFGPVMFARARYGHGGRLGYEREWRMRPEISGGGELIDQGMHMLDLLYWLMGPLPLHSAVLRSQFWDAEVEDNAAVLLGEPTSRDAPWASFHVTWTEWKNLFSLEVYCRTGKLQVDGLAGSYGRQRLRVYSMTPELGPPECEEIEYPLEDVSWQREWEHVHDVLTEAADQPMLGDLESARYAWACVERAYADAGLDHVDGSPR